MYCIRCGVELSAGEKKCPLCDTVVYHPDITFPDVPGTYPVFKKEGEKIKPIGALFILSMMFAFAYLLLLFIDLRGNKVITWSGYASNAILLLYVWIVLPFWSKKPNPVIFIPLDFMAVGIYLAYINYSIGGHWFLKFALPVVMALNIILTTVIVLLRYLHKGYLFIASGIWFSVGGFLMMLEALINYNFRVSKTLIWAPYPFASCCLIGGVLLVIAVNRPLRNSLHKRFFI